MTEVKTCYLCGEEMPYAFDWETQCYTCREKSRKSDLIVGIQSGEITETDYEDSVFCPYCGWEHEPDCESSKFYEDGDHVFQCEDCGNEFDLNTYIKITYSTNRRVKEDK